MDDTHLTVTVKGSSWVSAGSSSSSRKGKNASNDDNYDDEDVPVLTTLASEALHGSDGTTHVIFPAYPIDALLDAYSDVEEDDDVEPFDQKHESGRKVHSWTMGMPLFCQRVSDPPHVKVASDELSPASGSSCSWPPMGDHRAERLRQEILALSLLQDNDCLSFMNPMGVCVAYPKRVANPVTRRVLEGAVAYLASDEAKPFGGSGDPTAEYDSAAKIEVEGQQFNHNFVKDFARRIIFNGGGKEPGAHGGHLKIMGAYTQLLQAVEHDPAGANLSPVDRSKAVHIALTGIGQGFEAGALLASLLQGTQAYYKASNQDVVFSGAIDPSAPAEALEADKKIPRSIVAHVKEGSIYVSVTTCYDLQKSEFNGDLTVIDTLRTTRTYAVLLHPLKVSEISLQFHHA